MDIELPNGVVIQDVPEGATKAQIMQKAISAGLAKPSDFGVQEQPQRSLGEELVRQAGVRSQWIAVDRTEVPLPAGRGRSRADGQAFRPGAMLS